MAAYTSKCLCQADTQRQEPWGPQSEDWRKDGFKEKFCLQSNTIGASGRNCDFSLWDLSLKGRRDLEYQERVKEASLRSQAPASDGMIIA